MKDSWQLYDYLRSWWRLLLLCCALGILGAYLLDEPTVYAKEYFATATLVFPGQIWLPEIPALLGDSRPPQALISIESGPTATQEEAEAVLKAKVSKLSEYIGNPAERPDIEVQENSQGTWALWKGTTLGAVIGLLAAIGFIYVWTDAQSYRKRGPTAQSQ